VRWRERKRDLWKWKGIMLRKQKEKKKERERERVCVWEERDGHEKKEWDVRKVREWEGEWCSPNRDWLNPAWGTILVQV